MFDRLWMNTSIPVMSEMISFAEMRQSYLANNVANVDTPGYRSVDLPEDEFRRVLSRAIDARRNGITNGIELTGSSKIRSENGKLKIDPVRSGSNIRPDGNDVSLDLELAKLSKNSMEYQVLSRLMARRFAFLREVIRERAM